MGKHYNIVTVLLLFKIVLVALANAVWQKIHIRVYQKGTESSLFAGNVVVHLEDLREPTEKWLELIRWFSKSQIQNKYPGISSLLLYKDVGHSIFYNKK